MNTNVLLQVARRSQRYKCRGGSQQVQHSVHPMYKACQVQEVEGTATPIFPSLLSHSLPTLVQLEANRNVGALALLLQVYDDLKCEEGASFYSLRRSVLVRYFRKLLMQPPPRAFNAPLEKGRARPSQGHCGRTHLGLRAWPPPLACGLHGGPGPLSRWYFGPSLKFGCALLLFCLNAPSSLLILVNFHTCACKTCIYQNSWKM